MHLLVLGATGPCGVQLIQEALSTSHSVVIYARSPQKLPDSITSHSSVFVVKGELGNVELLSQAMAGVDAVLSALGPAVKSGPFHPSDTPLARAYAAIIDVMKKCGVKRLIALGTASIKDDRDKFSLEFVALVSGVALFARSAYKDVVAIGETIRAQGDGLEWTIARVPILTQNEKRDVLAGYIGDGTTKTTLARAGFAAFVINEVEKNEWCGKAPLISSP
ncbi:NAD-P-binding protein [Sparassis latifolia]|uniref:NAD-P-binding protein n=1 Tax=Sparassis crispa TaxID=139825 RepID=A0A401G8K8_9APHY|nr:NAD-P-binding protein [Sparassis crispa]GBE78488.1 NAD-P-binding protein [Sparassis crispa]